MEHKTFELIETKADGEAGTFTALASVFGNVDSVGDRMMPGAFKNSLERWRSSGDPIPIVLSHQWDDPMAHIGKADPADVVETERGLVVNGSLDIHDNPVAKQVHRLMKERRLKGWSFGYTVPKGGQKRSNGVNEVSEVDLIEAGPTLKGANPQAELQAIKSESVEETKSVPARLREIADALEGEDPPSEQDIVSQVQEMVTPSEGKTTSQDVKDQPPADSDDSTTSIQGEGAKHRTQDDLQRQSELMRLEVALGRKIS